jgi:hypothetical protein
MFSPSIYKVQGTKTGSIMCTGDTPRMNAGKCASGRPLKDCRINRGAWYVFKQRLLTARYAAIAVINLARI